jgi:signal peptidase I
MSETELRNVAEVPEEETTGGKKRKKKEKVKRPLWREILSWVLTLLCAFAAALVIRAIIFEPVRVDGESMDDTLSNGEIMLVSKYDYNSIWLNMPWHSDNGAQQAARFGWGNPNFLDVVICRYPARGAVNFVKRIVGMPGETVELREGYLYIDGNQVEAEKDLINPDYRVRGASDGYSFGPYRVPKKGDTLTVSGSSSSLQFLVNGEAWDRKKTTIYAKDESGKLLKIYNKKVEESRNGRAEQEMVVISWDGKDWTSANWSEIIPELSEKTFTLDENYYFVMGDHRLNSNDSRAVGALERTMIVGHVRRVAFPFNKWRGIK